MQRHSNLCSCCIRFSPQCSVCARNQAVTYKRCRSVCRVVRELITTVKAIQHIGVRLFHVIATNSNARLIMVIISSRVIFPRGLH